VKLELAGHLVITWIELKYLKLTTAGTGSGVLIEIIFSLFCQNLVKPNLAGDLVITWIRT
jgi:hypothetical protein